MVERIGRADRASAKVSPRLSPQDTVRSARRTATQGARRAELKSACRSRQAAAFSQTAVSKALIIFYMTVFLVLVNTMAGVASIPRNQVRAAENYGLSRLQLFALVTFPATLSFSIAGARIALGNSFAAVVGAELIAAEAGLGYRIVESGKWMAMNEMFAAMLVLGTFGLLADRGVRLATDRLLARYVPGSHAR